METGNVTASKPKLTGAIYNAPEGTKLPTDATSELDTKFVALGYASEDGLTNTNTPSCSTVKAWGGDVVLSVQTEKTDTYKFKLIEALNVDVLKVVYGSSNVSGEIGTGVTIKANSEDVEPSSWVIDSILRGGVLKRIVIPKGKISALGDIIYKDTEPVGYEITLMLEPDSEGNTHYEYMVKG